MADDEPELSSEEAAEAEEAARASAEDIDDAAAYWRAHAPAALRGLLDAGEAGEGEG
jgi:hypothetical protein